MAEQHPSEAWPLLHRLQHRELEGGQGPEISEETRGLRFLLAEVAELREKRFEQEGRRELGSGS